MLRAKRVAPWVALTAFAVMLGGCGNGQKPAMPASKASAAESPTASAPPTAWTEFKKGLIIATCQKIGDSKINITAYDAKAEAAGVVLSETSFKLTEGIGAVYAVNGYSIGGCGGYGGVRGATAFDYNSEKPFGKFFMSKKNADGSYTVNLVYRNGTSVVLSKVDANDNGLGKIVNDQFPSYHSGTNRVYYWDMSDKQKAKLMSVSPEGGDNREEPNAPGLESGHLAGFISAGKLYMPDTQQVVASNLKDSGFYNSAGTKKVTVDHGDLITSDVANPANKSEVKLEFGEGVAREPGTGYAGVPIGFVPGTNDKSIYTTDDVDLYRIDNGKVSLVYRNESRRRIKDAVVAADGDIAFMVAGSDGVTSAYVLPAGSKTPKRVMVTSGNYVVDILRFVS